MTLSSLEQDLQEFKEQKIEELTQYNSQLITELEEEFEDKKQKAQEKISKQLQENKEEYLNYEINTVKKEAKNIILKAKQEKALELSKAILEELKNEFSQISKLIITQASQVLGCRESELLISVNKEHEKEFVSIIGKKQIQIKNIEKFTFEAHYKSELVRFNLSEFIQNEVQTEVSKK